jgi:hypothetical protein
MLKSLAELQFRLAEIEQRVARAGVLVEQQRQSPEARPDRGGSTRRGPATRYKLSEADDEPSHEPASGNTIGRRRARPVICACICGPCRLQLLGPMLARAWALPVLSGLDVPSIPMAWAAGAGRRQRLGRTRGSGPLAWRRRGGRLNRKRWAVAPSPKAQHNADELMAPASQRCGLRSILSGRASPSQRPRGTYSQRSSDLPSCYDAQYIRGDAPDIPEAGGTLARRARCGCSGAYCSRASGSSKTGAEAGRTCPRRASAGSGLASPDRALGGLGGRSGRPSLGVPRGLLRPFIAMDPDEVGGERAATLAYDVEVDRVPPVQLGSRGCRARPFTPPASPSAQVFEHRLKIWLNSSLPLPPASPLIRSLASTAGGRDGRPVRRSTP